MSVQTLEKKLQSDYLAEIEQIYIGDTHRLFDGSIRIQEAISENIDNCLKTQALLSWGTKVSVTVKTQKNVIVYPDVFEPITESLPPISPVQRAEDNYAILKQGLIVEVDVKILHNGLLSYALLSVFIMLSVLLFLYCYRLSSKKAEKDESDRKKQIERFLELERTHSEKLKDLNTERQVLSEEIERIRLRYENEREKASRTEDEMIDEIVALEGNLEKNLMLQEEKESEIRALEDKIQQYEAGRIKTKKQKMKAADAARKRFKTLYKKVSVHDRAVNGFAALTLDQQLKAEEIILKLHDDPKLVPIKRKVFGKKNRETVFEVLFSYKGRLYYRTTQENILEILSIGTKHTQGKDLEFLDNL